MLNKIASIALLFCLPLFAFAEDVKTYLFEEALEKELITVESIKRISNERGNLQIIMHNASSKKDIKIRFLPGLHFASQDTGVQDLLITVPKTMLVRAGGKAGPILKGYCTQASKSGPSGDYVFNEKKQGPLLEVAEFLATRPSLGAISQHAIWIVTDDHDLEGLYHQDEETSVALQEYMSKLTGKPMPKYTIEYPDPELAPNEPAFEPHAVRIHGKFEYTIPKDCVMNMKIYNEQGEEVQRIFHEQPVQRGQGKLTFKFEAWDLPQGKYVARLTLDGETTKELWVES